MKLKYSISLSFLLIFGFLVSQSNIQLQRTFTKQNEIKAETQSPLIEINTIVNENGLAAQLKALLANKTKLNDIMQVVDSFYNSLSTELKNNGGDGLIKYKQWKRWEYMMSKQVNPDGTFVNSAELIMKADEEETRKNNGNNRSQLPGSWNNIGMKKSEYSPDTANNSYANGIGRVDRIAFHPSNASTIFVGTPYGGLWKTSNGGTTWQCMTDTLPALGISGIVVDKFNANNIYILTGTGDNSANSFVTLHEYAQPSIGVMKSTDGGINWTLLSLPSTPNTNYIGYDLVQNPIYASELLAATSDGVFLTLNSGSTWTKVKSGNHFDVEYKPNDSDIAYCADANNFYRSTDFGQTWTTSTLTPNLSNNNRIAIGVTPLETNVVYLLCGSNTGVGSFKGVYKSFDSGSVFARLATTPNILGYETDGQDAKDQGGYDLCIAASSTVSNRVVFGGINIWTTTNGGSTITNQTKWYETYADPNAFYVHPDHHALAYNPLDQKLYNCNDGGIYYSTNHGNSWVNISEGLVVSQFYHLAQYKTNSYIVSGGLQDNGIKHRNKGSKNHVHLYGADGFSTSFQPNNSNVIYSTVNDGGLRVNAITGTSLPFTMPDQGGAYFKHIMAHSSDTNTVYVGGNAAFYTSTDKGSNWSTNSTVQGYWAMEISPSTPQRMYIAGGANFSGAGGMWTTANGGTSWTTISNIASGFPIVYNRVTDIAINPPTPNEVYVSVGGFLPGFKVYFSNNSGASWSNFSYNLPNVVIHSLKVANGKVYAGTDLGLYVRNFATSTWTSIRDNMPKTPVSDVYIDENTGNIICSTFGRGVWQRDFCVNDITLTGQLKGRLDYSANNMITASTLTPGMNNVDSIFLNGKSKILLTPGFHAKTGTHMKTSQQPCDNGSQPFQGEVPKSEGVFVGRKE